MPHPLHVLVIGYVWPEPRSSAAGGHMMQLLEAFLAQGWCITFASPAKVGEHKADLATLGISEAPIQLNDSSFDTFVGQLQPDVVLFDRFMMEEQFGWRVEKHCPHALRVLETSDLQSLRDARQALLKERLKQAPDNHDFSSLFAASQDELFGYMAERDITQREIAAIYRCDLSLMISPAEIELLTQRFAVPAALLLWCPLMVDSQRPAAPGFAERAHFLSIGNFRHAPNWDAVLWMKNTLWPLIRQRLPQAQLHVYGAYTPPKATALHNAAQGFHVKGWAEDALEVMAASRIALAPLRFGAGIKGKLLDAMLCGTPSVTTPVGAEGMCAPETWPGAVHNSANALAEAAVNLYTDERCWAQAHARGYALLDEQFSFARHAPALTDLIQSLRANLSAHRRANFTGSMLRHHQHKSTQYFGQWIEAKNRSSLSMDP
jgi:glycosyltransferase involved in cell wall biosynthesis